MEELTKDAGISKGAFYQFFASKELLFFDIFEELSRTFQAHFLRVYSTDSGMKPAALRLKQALLAGHEWVKENPAMQRFTNEDFMYLARKLPTERIIQHQQQDMLFFQTFAKQEQLQKECPQFRAEHLQDVMHAIFLLHLQKDTFQGGFELVIKALVTGFIDELTGG